MVPHLDLRVKAVRRLRGDPPPGSQRRERSVEWRGEFSLGGTLWKSAGLIDPADLSGTDIDYDQELTVGLYVQHNCTANFDYIVSGFVPASDKSGMGDGVTGLASNSSGVPHVFYWDAPGDLGADSFASRVELQLTAEDVDGMGSSATTGIFRFIVPIMTNVEKWELLR